ncbi:MAG: hypothetical protein WC707_06950 [Candidatus Babeliaceae bacterium]|jgi:hypothetical protein
MKTIAKVGIAAGVAAVVIGVVAASSNKKTPAKTSVNKTVVPIKATAPVKKENKGLKIFDAFSKLANKTLTNKKEASESDNRANFDFSKESVARSGSGDSYGSFGY